MAQGKRHRHIPRLESMEDRMVPSAVNFSPSVSAEIHRFGRRMRGTADGMRQYFTSLYQHRPGHPPILSWTTHRTPPTHTSNTGLFGIPWLKF